MALYIGQPRQTALGALASGVGQGIAGGLEAREAKQLQQMQAQALGKLPGMNLNSQQAQALSMLPPQLQQAYVKQALQAPANEAFNKSLESLVGGGQPDSLAAMQGMQPQQQAQPVQPGQTSPWPRQQAPAQAAQQAPPAAAQPQGFKIPPGMPKQQAMQLAQLALQQQQKKEAAHDRKYAQIQKANAPYLKNLTTVVDTSKKINTLAKSMKALWETGKVAHGLGGLPGKLPGVAGKVGATFLNDETREFDALSNEMAILKSKEETGGALRALGLVHLMQTAKPEITQDRKTQGNRIDDILRSSSQGILKGELRDYLIDFNNGEPANIETQINKLAKKIPDIHEDVEEGDVWKDSDTGQYYTVRNGLQVPIMPPQGAQ